MADDHVCELPKNAREVIRFRLGEWRPGQRSGPHKEEVAVSPHLWPMFKKCLAETEAAMIKEGWKTWRKSELAPGKDRVRRQVYG